MRIRKTIFFKVRNIRVLTTKTFITNFHWKFRLKMGVNAERVLSGEIFNVSTRNFVTSGIRVWDKKDKKDNEYK